MKGCIFCKIANKEIKSEIVSENGEFIAFKDINPKALIHVLIIPKNHVGPVNTLSEDDNELISGLILEAKEISKQIGISENGYRLIFNVGKDAGMEIDHLHLHLLAGKSLTWQ